MSQRANGQGCSCGACHGSGWLPFDKVVDGQRLSWSAACYCAAGVYLTQPREPAKPSDPQPVVIQHAPREVYTRRLAQADAGRDARRAA